MKATLKFVLSVHFIKLLNYLRAQEFKSRYCILCVYFQKNVNIYFLKVVK
jgi:hypothetical protein